MTFNFYKTTFAQKYFENLNKSYTQTSTYTSKKALTTTLPYKYSKKPNTFETTNNDGIDKFMVCQ